MGLFWTQGEPKLAGTEISGDENAWNDNDLIKASSVEENLFSQRKIVSL